MTDEEAATRVPPLRPESERLLSCPPTEGSEYPRRRDSGTGGRPPVSNSSGMEREALPLDGSLRLRPAAFEDARGSFMEVYAEPRYRALGIAETFVQDNLSISKRGVLRGLHGDPRMAKLVQVIRGEVYDAIVDLRRESPTFRRWTGVRLKAEERTQLYIPAGFLHGFLALSDDVIFLYKQTATYDPSHEFGVAWNDPDLAIEWPLHGAPTLSEKDAANKTLRELGYL